MVSFGLGGVPRPEWTEFSNKKLSENQIKSGMMVICANYEALVSPFSFIRYLSLFPYSTISLPNYLEVSMAKRRNPKKEKALRNQAYARKFRKRSPGRFGRRFFNDNRNEAKESENATPETLEGASD